MLNKLAVERILLVGPIAKFTAIRRVTCHHCIYQGVNQLSTMPVYHGTTRCKPTINNASLSWDYKFHIIAFQLILYTWGFTELYIKSWTLVYECERLAFSPGVCAKLFYIDEGQLPLASIVVEVKNFDYLQTRKDCDSNKTTHLCII